SRAVAAPPGEDNDAQLFTQSRTLRIRQLDGLDLSIGISTSPLQAVTILPLSDFHEVSRAGEALSDNWGSPRIAQQIALVFGVAIDKDMVRRILSVHYRPDSGSPGPPGSPFWATRRTVCGAAICSAANRQP